jgi:FixJ family two-component response regulator
MPHDKPIVFVVDDDASVRESLSFLIDAAGWEPETFASAKEFLSRPQALVPCCLILDVHLPDLSGLDLQALIGDRVAMPIIFITGYGDAPTIVRAMQAGAVEFLTKPLVDEVLIAAIRSAIDRSRAEIGHAAELRALRNDYASLSCREQEVMALVTAGSLNKQVGSQLGISEITVKAHRGRLMRKMHAGSLPDLVKMAVMLCLTSLWMSDTIQRSQGNIKVSPGTIV